MGEFKMKKLTALLLTLVLCATSLLGLVAYAKDDVTFSGDFSTLTLVVGQGKEEDLYEGITAKDTETGADLTAEIRHAGQEVKFDTVDKYKIIYFILGKTSFKERIINIVKSNTQSDLIHRRPDNGYNYLHEPDFESVAETKRKLIYEMYTNEELTTIKYSWLFNGEDIKAEDAPTRFDVNVYNTCKNADEIKKAVGKVNYKIISFGCGETKFPAPAEMLFSVSDVFKEKATLYLYKYTDDKLVLVADSIEVNGAGYVTKLVLEKGGDYVLTDKKAGYKEPVSSQETSSKVTSSTPVSSKPSSTITSSEFVSSEITSSELVSTEVTSSQITSSETTGSNSPDVSTILLVVILSAVGLMALTIIAFAIVRKNA